MLRHTVKLALRSSLSRRRPGAPISLSGLLASRLAYELHPRRQTQAYLPALCKHPSFPQTTTTTNQKAINNRPSTRHGTFILAMVVVTVAQLSIPLQFYSCMMYVISFMLLFDYYLSHLKEVFHDSVSPSAIFMLQLAVHRM